MVENIQVKKFLNDHFRPLCTETAKNLVRIKAILAKAAADGIAELVPNDSTVIDDESVEQGYPAVTGEDFHKVLGLLAELATDSEGVGSRAPSLIRIARDVLP